MRRIQLFFIGGAFAIGGAIVACSGDNTQNDGGPGDGSVADVKPDKTPPPSDGGTDAPIVTPAGTELAASDQVQIFGITTDDDVIYADTTAGGLYAVAAGGGTPTKIGAPSSYAVGVSGHLVFVWANLTSNEVGALSVWKHGGTLTAVTTNSAPNGGFASSTDGTHIMYTANANTAGAVGDIVGANADGTAPNSLVTNIDIGSNDCRPLFGFANNTTAVTSTCGTTPPDGGTPSATIDTYAIAAGGDAGTLWTQTQIATGALDVWSTDTAGDQILVATPSGLSTYPIGGGTAVPIDNKDIGHYIGEADWSFGYLTKNAGKVIYSTAAGELLTAVNGASPNASDIQATNANYIRAIASTEGYIMYTKTFDSQYFGGDLYLTATTANATPVTLSSVTTSALFGITALDDFSADSSYVIWIENLDTNQGIGDLYAVPVTGGTPKQYGTGIWQNASATGTKIIFNDNCNGCSGSGGTGDAYADIEAIDLTSAGGPTKLQAGADVPLSSSNSLWMNNAKDHVIYSYSQNAPSTGTVAPGGNGLYAIAIP